MIRAVPIAARLAVVLAALVGVVGAGSSTADALGPPRQQANGFFDVDLDVSPPGQSGLGTPLSLEVSVALRDGPPVDAGEVTFYRGSAVIATVAVSAEGRATTTFTPPSAGVYDLWARWVGHDPFGSFAESQVHEHTVIDPATVPPRVHPEVHPDRAPAGTLVSLAVYLEDHQWSRDLTAGQVVFLDGDVPIAAAPVVEDFDVYVASAEVTLPAGVHELSALFLGTADIPRATSANVTHSALPETCADQAQPGTGALVRLGYLTALGRCPDAAGFAYWTGRLDAGVSPEALGRGLAPSAEGVAATVDAAYRRVLDRPADPAGRAVWAAKLRAGWTTSQLWAALAASPEFLAGAPGDDRTGALLERAFASFLGRPLDDAGRAYWYGRLFSSSRSSVMRSLVLAPEALDRLVDTASLAVRGHAASPEEGHVGAIKARRGDWRLLVGELLADPVAADHAQTYPDLAG